MNLLIQVIIIFLLFVDQTVLAEEDNCYDISLFPEKPITEKLR